MKNKIYTMIHAFLHALGITKKITRPRIEQFLQKHATETLTLDIGSGNAPYQTLFPNIKKLDTQERPGHKLDYIADIHDMSMIQGNSFDCILLTEVLEHLHSPEKALSECERILRPQGKIIITTRFIFPLHETPIDYFRYTKYGLKHLLRNFEIIDFEEEANTMETLAILYQRIGFQSETLYVKPLKIVWFILARCTLLFSKIITREYSDIHHTHEEYNILSSGYYVVAKKR